MKKIGPSMNLKVHRRSRSISFHLRALAGIHACLWMYIYIPGTTPKVQFRKLEREYRARATGASAAGRKASEGTQEERTCIIITALAFRAFICIVLYIYIYTGRSAYIMKNERRDCETVSSLPVYSFDVSTRIKGYDYANFYGRESAAVEAR